MKMKPIGSFADLRDRYGTIARIEHFKPQYWQKRDEYDPLPDGAFDQTAYYIVVSMPIPSATDASIVAVYESDVFGSIGELIYEPGMVIDETGKPVIKK